MKYVKEMSMKNIYGYMLLEEIVKAIKVDLLSLKCLIQLVMIPVFNNAF